MALTDSLPGTWASSAELAAALGVLAALLPPLLLPPLVPLLLALVWPLLSKALPLTPTTLAVPLPLLPLPPLLLPLLLLVDMRWAAASCSIRSIKGGLQQQTEETGSQGHDLGLQHTPAGRAKLLLQYVLLIPLHRPYSMSHTPTRSSFHDHTTCSHT